MQTEGTCNLLQSYQFVLVQEQALSCFNLQPKAPLPEGSMHFMVSLQIGDPHIIISFHFPRCKGHFDPFWVIMHLVETCYFQQSGWMNP